MLFSVVFFISVFSFIRLLCSVYTDLVSLIYIRVHPLSRGFLKKFFQPWGKDVTQCHIDMHYNDSVENQMTTERGQNYGKSIPTRASSQQSGEPPT